MKVTETKSEGLYKEFSVVIPAEEIAKKVKEQLEKLAGKVKIPGFRPGKVPMQILQQKYGKGAREDAVGDLLKSQTESIMRDKKLRPAMPAKIKDVKDEEGKDLEYSFELETLPELKDVSFDKIKLERLKIDVSDKMVQETLENVAKQHKTPVELKKERASKEGDMLVIDFEGKVDGVAFQGGKAEKYELELGSKTFIPGFEDQLVGKKTGEDVAVKVAFPEDYPAADLKGKDAVFDVKIHEIKELEQAKIDDALAEKLGFEKLETFKEEVKKSLSGRYESLTRDRSKRELLDALAEEVKCELPKTMVQEELKGILHQMEHSMSKEELEKERKGKSQEDLEAEYLPLAERRVRLGLFLAEVGRKNKLSVKEQDITKAIYERAMAYPGQEKEVLDFYKSTPQAVDQLRAPLFEDLVIDFIFDKVKFTERSVTPEEFEKEEEKAEKAAEEKATSKKKEPKKAASAKK